MILKSLKVLIISALATLSLSALAGANDPLFINLTTDDAHRSTMAITFGKHHSGNGHPGSEKYAAQQKELTEIISKGGLVIICPSCLKNSGYTEADLIPGIKIGSPKLTGDALFKDGTKTMSW
jgi:hypothetical protein